MSSLRPFSMLRSVVVTRPVIRPALSTVPRARACPVRLAHQDYGSGEGNPVGENPQQQGKNPSENLEHPGPPPPKVAKGKSPSPDEKSSSPSQKSSSQKSSSQSKSSSKSQPQSQSNDGASKSGSPQPKILNENPPTESNASEGVKQHNKEMENRAEKAFESVSNEEAERDKVPPKFWSGQGGRDDK